MCQGLDPDKGTADAHALQGCALAVAVGVHGQQDDVLHLPLQVGQAVVANIVQAATPTAHATAIIAGCTPVYGSPAAGGARLPIVLHTTHTSAISPETLVVSLWFASRRSTAVPSRLHLSPQALVHHSGGERAGSLPKASGRVKVHFSFNGRCTKAFPADCERRWSTSARARPLPGMPLEMCRCWKMACRLW